MAFCAKEIVAFKGRTKDLGLFINYPMVFGLCTIFLNFPHFHSSFSIFHRQMKIIIHFLQRGNNYVFMTR